MRKFKFRLEALLKIREFKEKTLKVELGQIQNEIVTIETKIASLKEHIKDAYIAQNKVLEDPVNGQMVRFFPYYIQAKTEDIRNSEILKAKLSEKFEVKLKELKAARGETKMVESLKEKSKLKHKKQKEKNELQNIEEIIMMRQKKSSV